MLRGIISAVGAVGGAGTRGVALTSRRAASCSSSFNNTAFIRFASTTPKPTPHSDSHAPPPSSHHSHSQAAPGEHGHGEHGHGEHGHGHGEHVDLSYGHDHHDHHHIDHSNAPYGILFGEVYEGKRKIPRWEWIYYVGMGASILTLIYVYWDFDERKIQTWAKATYAKAMENAAEAEAKMAGSRAERDAKLARFGTTRKEEH